MLLSEDELHFGKMCPLERPDETSLLKRRLKDTVNNYTHLDIWKPHQIQEDVQTVNIQISYSC